MRKIMISYSANLTGQKLAR